MISAYKIDLMPETKRTAILVAFVKAYEIIALDVLDLLITDIAGEAKKLGQKKRLRTLKDLDKSALALAKVCALLLDDNLDDESLCPSVFAKFSREKLAQSISTVHELVRPYDDNFHEEMVEQYGQVQRFLPKLLRDIEFSTAPVRDKTLEVHQYLAQLLDSKNKFLMMCQWISYLIHESDWY